MTLSRELVVPGMQSEYQEFAVLVRGLTDAEWERPSRCDSWRVADVAAHVVGQLTDVVNLRLEGLGSPEVTERQVAERRGRSTAELADELEAATKVAADMAGAFDDAAWEGPIPGAGPATLGSGLEALWFDTFLHADDIRAPLGRLGDRGEGILASLSHIAQILTEQGWGPAELRLDGYPAFPVSGGGGRQVTGDAFQFVLVSTGRADAAAAGLDPTVNIYR